MEREEAIDIVKDTITYNISSPRVREALETLIPELEKNDENLRKTLIKLFTEDPGQQYGGYTKEKILAWLEKQGEQKSVWGEEDECRFNNLIRLIENSSEGEATKQGFITFINKIKSSKQQCLKPTTEQMQTLHAQLVEGAITYSEDKRVLTTLYEDLIKIK